MLEHLRLNIGVGRAANNVSMQVKSWFRTVGLTFFLFGTFKYDFGSKQFSLSLLRFTLPKKKIARGD
mgnify:CR=1 FL=1